MVMLQHPWDGLRLQSFFRLRLSSLSLRSELSVTTMLFSSGALDPLNALRKDIFIPSLSDARPLTCLGMRFRQPCNGSPWCSLESVLFRKALHWLQLMVHLFVNVFSSCTRQVSLDFTNGTIGEVSGGTSRRRDRPAMEF